VHKAHPSRSRMVRVTPRVGGSLVLLTLAGAMHYMHRLAGHQVNNITARDTRAGFTQ
jgi:hypothetical protein